MVSGNSGRLDEVIIRKAQSPGYTLEFSDKNKIRMMLKKGPPTPWKMEYVDAKKKNFRLAVDQEAATRLFITKVGVMAERPRLCLRQKSIDAVEFAISNPSKSNPTKLRDTVSSKYVCIVGETWLCLDEAITQADEFKLELVKDV